MIGSRVYVFEDKKEFAKHDSPLILCLRGARNCYRCRDKSDKLKRCSRCHLDRYCSKKCQKRRWKRHKETCRSPDHWSSQRALIEVSAIAPYDQGEWSGIFKRMFNLIHCHQIHPNKIYLLPTVQWRDSKEDMRNRVDPTFRMNIFSRQFSKDTWAFIEDAVETLAKLGLDLEILTRQSYWIGKQSHCSLFQRLLDNGHDLCVSPVTTVDQFPFAKWLVTNHAPVPFSAISFEACQAACPERLCKR